MHLNEIVQNALAAAWTFEIKKAGLIAPACVMPVICYKLFVI